MQVAAVVVTWNRRELLREALAALRAQTLPPVCIVVVDNASTDGTDELLREEAEHGDLDVVRLGKNTGGAGGFNACKSYLLWTTPPRSGGCVAPRTTKTLGSSASPAGGASEGRRPGDLSSMDQAAPAAPQAPVRSEPCSRSR